MLIYSMGVSVDGFITDREGAFGWGVPSEEQVISASPAGGSYRLVLAYADASTRAGSPIDCAVDNVAVDRERDRHNVRPADGVGRRQAATRAAANRRRACFGVTRGCTPRSPSPTPPRLVRGASAALTGTTARPA